jgi:hypothetical protein
MAAWNVYLNDELIDTVFAAGYDAEEMRRSLINHDGYDPSITVEEQTTMGERMVPASETKAARGQ